jgi:predicted dehydrogenase
VATGSRSSGSAEAFAREYGGAGHGSYEAVLHDSAVQAVYVALPNHLHHEWTLKSLAAGKHVLCEKPLAANARQAEEMFDAAARAGRVLVEAFMYRCLPAVRKFVRAAREGRVGEIKLIRANFTFSRPVRTEDFRYHLEMAGGSLMDVGCYCLDLARALAGAEPTEVRALGRLHPSGVDEYAAGLLQFGDRLLATFTCGMTVESDTSAFVGGADGWMCIDSPWLTSNAFTIVRGGHRRFVRASSRKGVFTLEAEAFADVVLRGASPWLTPHDSIGNMRVLDELRRQIGIKMP